jgi:hypothetical protein
VEILKKWSKQRLVLLLAIATHGHIVLSRLPCNEMNGLIQPVSGDRVKRCRVDEI